MGKVKCSEGYKACAGRCISASKSCGAAKVKGGLKNAALAIGSNLTGGTAGHYAGKYAAKGLKRKKTGQAVGSLVGQAAGTVGTYKAIKKATDKKHRKDKAHRYAD